MVPRMLSGRRYGAIAQIEAQVLTSEGDSATQKVVAIGAEVGQGLQQDPGLAHQNGGDFQGTD